MSNIKDADHYLNWVVLEYLRDHDTNLQNICIIDLMKYSHRRCQKYVSAQVERKVGKLFEETDGPLYYSDVADELNVDLSTAMEACERLLKKGLITTQGKAKV